MQADLLVSRLKEKYAIKNFSGCSLWELRMSVVFPRKLLEVGPVEKNEDLHVFGQGLSSWSKDMFCPYPWDDYEKSNLAFKELIQHHREHRDLVYMLFSDKRPVGLGFLWNLRKKGNLCIPELGEGIVDSYQGRHLGSFLLDTLTYAADILECYAVELTTDLRNNDALRLYLSRGYGQLGIIKNPLEMDQTRDISELAKADWVRDEYHMAKVFRNESAVLAYLRQKREKQNESLRHTSTS